MIDGPLLEPDAIRVLATWVAGKECASMEATSPV